MKATNPFEAGGKASSSSASQAGRLDLADDPVVALQYDLLRLVPVSHLLGGLEVGGEAAVEVLEDAVLISEPAICAFRRAFLDGREGSGL